MEKQVIVAGALVRGNIRKLLMRMGIPFQEDKGWIESHFFVSPKDAKQVASFINGLNQP